MRYYNLEVIADLQKKSYVEDCESAIGGVFQEKIGDVSGEKVINNKPCNNF